MPHFFRRERKFSKIVQRVNRIKKNKKILYDKLLLNNTIFAKYEFIKY